MFDKRDHTAARQLRLELAPIFTTTYQTAFTTFQQATKLKKQEHEATLYLNKLTKTRATESVAQALDDESLNAEVIAKHIEAQLSKATKPIIAKLTRLDIQSPLNGSPGTTQH